MSDIVVSVENLSKRYHLGVIGTGTLRDDLKIWFARQRGKPNPLSRIDDRAQREKLDGEIWALKDINFEVKQGESLGIIGRNGAGKSTLLKILSRVTAPTSGRVRVKGRIASLLEVGTGFHPELTGRENVYLNGTIMGLRKAEVTHIFDEIVDFSGIEKFIDTPVKRYSSGMYVRLAFAVAAHLDPEILVIDEVLAVGDAEFQKKCLGKIGEVTKEGRTVLFVSHNMGSVEALCNRCILLEYGSILSNSVVVSEVIHQYLQMDTLKTNLKGDINDFDNKYFHLKSFNIQNTKGIIRKLFLKSEIINIISEIEIHDYHPGLNIGYAIYENQSNACLWWSFCKDRQDMKLISGHHELLTTIPAGTLNDGSYRVEFLAAIHNQEWLSQPGQNIANQEFTIKGGALGEMLTTSTSRPGMLFPIYPWKTIIK